MAYIGSEPAASFTSFAKQDFSTSATTSYTLDHPVTNANDIALFVNFVRQEPTTAYSASGTTLTLTEATASSDDMYCVFLGQALQTVNPPAGSVGTSQLADSSVTAAKLASGAVSNAPAFEATISASQTLTENAYTKLAFDTENFDTAGNYDHATNYRFTPQTAGKYFFYVNGIFNAGGSGEFERIRLALYKNGSLVYYQQEGSQSQQVNSQRRAQTIQKIIELNGSSDYVEAFAFFEHDAQGAGILELIESGKNNVFGAYKLIGI